MNKTCTCILCGKEYTPGFDGLFAGCDSCLDIRRLPNGYWYFGDHSADFLLEAFRKTLYSIWGTLPSYISDDYWKDASEVVSGVDGAITNLTIAYEIENAYSQRCQELTENVE